MPQLILIGIDAATMNLILKWKDKLKFFNMLLEEGAYGYLQSTTPPLSPAAWTSIYTGKKPSKTKFYDWLKYPTHPCKKPRVRLASSFDLREPTIWDIAAVHGFKSAIINAPLTYPSTYLNGLMISGVPAHLFSSYPITYPVNLREELDSLVNGYEVMPKLDIFRFFEYDLIKRLEMVIEKRRKVIEHIYSKDEWNLFMPVFFVLDTIQHYFWSYIDEKHPLHKKDSLSNVIFYFYKKIDSILYNFVKKIDECSIIVVSDHGAGPLHGYFLVNKFLASIGLLKTRKSSILRLLATLIFSIIEMDQMFFIYEIVKRTRIPLVDKLLDKPLIKQIVERFSFFPLMELMSGDFLEEIDWKDTLAFALGAVGGIFISRTLPGEKREKIEKTIKKAFKNIRLPSGKIANIDFFKGYDGEDSPDFFYSIENYKYLPVVHLSGLNSKIFEKPLFFTGWHRPLGVFFAYGPLFKKNTGGKIPTYSIYDVAPTVLYSLGLPILSDMDGKPIFEIFSNNARRELRVKIEKAVRYRLARKIHLMKTKITLVGQKAIK